MPSTCAILCLALPRKSNTPRPPATRTGCHDQNHRRLTWDLVGRLRREYVRGRVGYWVLAKRYGLHGYLVWQVVNWRMWRNPPEDGSVWKVLDRSLGVR